ncbi:MAG: xanthan lyase [Bacteroidaceae bacterium]|nr:xanthan lyase [Bacteroidaceae bacterium]
MFRRVQALLAALIVATSVLNAQTDNAVIRSKVREHFKNYQSDVELKSLKVQRTDISAKGRRIDIYLNEVFGWQQFRPGLVDSIYSSLRADLPAGVRKYGIRLYAGGKPIEQLVPNWARSQANRDCLWNDTRYEGRPWVENASRPFRAAEGLENIHMAVTPSHGMYYDNEDDLWEWQRPPLYCTHEDLLTQSFVYPYLIPMLENAGAVVYTARERDWQTRSVTVKAGTSDCIENGLWSVSCAGGWDPDSARICPDTLQVPTKYADAGSGPGIAISNMMWVPDIPEDGEYAVYVTYQSESTSIDDARYIVFHSAGTTTFHVNQQIGGGTWVYLGTFHFKKGRTPQGMVTLDNSSRMNGTVNADAVRFGGGTAIECREDNVREMPRYNEGARYYTRFAGAPDSIWLKYDGDDDYREDIWARPYMANWLSGGSVFNKANPGLGVPLELYFALHTDAGYRYGDTLVGPVGICTTSFNDGLLGDGHPREMSRDLTDMVLTGLKSDIEAGTGLHWSNRGIWDSNYCESREPQMPAMLLELLSHQNFCDLKLAMNPNFRFLVSRSLYKSILKYVSFLHERNYVVQPLPVDHFSVTNRAGMLELSWQATTDTLEPTAKPDAYIVYTAIDDKGFDNGVLTESDHYSIEGNPGTLYRFKVTAVNSGGQSFPSETLAAGIVENSPATVLVINGFQRLSAPETVETDSTLGFDILRDPGVQYMRSPILCGPQQIFSRDSIDLDPDRRLSLGISDDSYNGDILAGNTFDYPEMHGRAIMAAGYSFVSCSRESVQDGNIGLEDYRIADLILGLQKRSLQDTLYCRDYSTFPAVLQEKLTRWLKTGGCLLCSGSYVGADMISSLSDESFTTEALHYRWDGPLPSATATEIKGMHSSFDILRVSDDRQYGVTRPDVISPSGKADILLRYSGSRLPAGIGYKGADYRCITMGFPFESITSFKEQERLMKGILRYLTDK